MSWHIWLCKGTGNSLLPQDPICHCFSCRYNHKHGLAFVITSSLATPNNAFLQASVGTVTIASWSTSTLAAETRPASCCLTAGSALVIATGLCGRGSAPAAPLLCRCTRVGLCNLLTRQRARREVLVSGEAWPCKAHHAGKSPSKYFLKLPAGIPCIYATVLSIIGMLHLLV